MYGKIYTRKGDRGETGLSGGRRVGKDDARVQAYGTLDELQAQLGLARAFIRRPELNALVFSLEEEIAVACAQLSSDPQDFPRLKRVLGDAEIARMEAEIDRLVAGHGLPGGFIVPGRGPDSAAAHVARTVCRRAERLVVAIDRGTPAYANLCAYLNRLSDLLFALAWSLEVESVAEEAVRAIVEGSR
ncbi:MAG: cob(I)yrinic acid a,c-diamide adenosyltransferase [Rhodospirillaceae bacterium]